MNSQDGKCRPGSRTSGRATQRKAPSRGVDRRTTRWMDNLLPDRMVRRALTLDGKRYTLVLELPPGPRVFF